MADPQPVRIIARKSLSASKFPLLDRRGRRERLSLIASGGVVDKLMLAQRSLLLRCLIYHPVCAIKEGGLFLDGAPTPPVQEGKFAGRHIFLGITRTLFAFCITLLFAAPAFAQTVSYAIAMPQPSSHTFRVDMTIDGPGMPSVELSLLPSWNGLYEIRDSASTYRISGPMCLSSARIKTRGALAPATRNS